MAEDGDDSGKEDKDKTVKTGAAPAAASVLPKCTRDLSEIETAVDNLARVNLMLEESGCEALKSYCRATFDALVRQVKLHILWTFWDASYHTCLSDDGRLGGAN